MTPEVQQYLLAGFLLLAAVFAVPLLKRILRPVKKRISDRIPALVGHLLRCFLRPAAWLVRVTLAGWAVLTIPWSAEIRVLLTRAMPYYQAFVLAMAAWGVWEAAWIASCKFVFVAATTRTLVFCTLAEPTRMNSPVCNTRNNRTWVE